MMHDGLLTQDAEEIDANERVGAERGQVQSLL
jgi:hypothetical protein